MSPASLRDRVARADPLVVDIALAVLLALVACGQIALFTHLRSRGVPVPPGGHGEFIPREPTLLLYALAAGSFLPLALRRTVPWLAFALTGFAALAYQLMPRMEPAITVLGPMIALYSVAAYAHRRRVGLIALLAFGLVAAVPAFAFSSDVRWTAQVVGTFVLLAAAALLGEAERNRREYVAEVERRAVEAERTREEEALRRVDEERIRIAREVHDIVAHGLSIVTVQAGAASALLDRDPERARESIEHVRATGKQALSELRSMLDVLRTGEGAAPLPPAEDLTQLDRLIAPVRDAGIAVDLVTNGALDAVPAYATVSAYRIIQEALTNVVRHAGASHVLVAVEVGDTGLAVVIEDDGSAAPDLVDGHGIRGMRERVEALSGRFEAGARSGGGFRVAATLPLTRSTP
jgi:signal transduction histidine kinase